MCVQNLKFLALPIPGIIGGTLKNCAVRGYAHVPFSPKFLMDFCSDGPCECFFQICSPYIALPVPETAIGILAFGLSYTNTIYYGLLFPKIGGSQPPGCEPPRFATPRLRTPNLGEEEAVGGQEWYRSKERW